MTIKTNNHVFKKGIKSQYDLTLELVRCKPNKLGLTVNEWAVLLVISDRVDGGTFGNSYPSVKTMANELGLGERTVKRATRKLEELGYIAKQKRFNNSIIYTIIVEALYRGVTENQSSATQTLPDATQTPRQCHSGPLITPLPTPTNNTHIRDTEKEENKQADEVKEEIPSSEDNQGIVFTSPNFNPFSQPIDDNPTNQRAVNAVEIESELAKMMEAEDRPF